MKQPKNSGVTSEWKSAEHIAAILEKALSPEAHVEHNVHLPVIGSDSGRTRQCDVVITLGKPPRQTVAIVEVQKRNKKPDINTFHGWYRKMQEVGAQQLICVSALGYPKSIIEEVSTRIGPTVKLLTLEDIKDRKILGSFLFNLAQLTPKYKITDFGILDVIYKNSGEQELEFDPSIPYFSIRDDAKRYSLNEIICSSLNNSNDVSFTSNILIQNRIHSTIINNSFPTQGLRTDSCIANLNINDSNEVWIDYLNTKAKIKNWTIKLNLYYEQVILPTSVFAYRQEFVNDTLAWVGHTQFVHEKQDYEMSLVFKPNEDGLLLVSAQILRHI